MYLLGWIVGAVILTNVPSMRPTTPGNPAYLSNAAFVTSLSAGEGH